MHNIHIISLLTRWVIETIAIIVTAYILPGVSVEGLFVAFVLAVVLGLFNAFLKPIIFFLTLPITIVTLGLFTLITNAFLIMLAGWIVPGFFVSNFWWALLFGIILSVITAILRGGTKHQLNKNKNEPRVYIQE